MGSTRRSRSKARRSPSRFSRSTPSDRVSRQIHGSNRRGRLTGEHRLPNQPGARRSSSGSRRVIPLRPLLCRAARRRDLERPPETQESNPHERVCLGPNFQNRDEKVVMNISRRMWLNVCWTLVVGCSSAEKADVTPPTTVKQEVAAKKPNIVLILTDDLNQEVFSHSDKLQALLAIPGTTFINNLVSLSLCCPSRVATLRGQFAHNSGIFSNGGDNGGFAKVYKDGLESSTAATWLQGAGYRTALIGKYLNGYPTGAPSKTYIPPGWTLMVQPERW